jgi:serine/threonine-protein kinase
MGLPLESGQSGPGTVPLVFAPPTIVEAAPGGPVLPAGPVPGRSTLPPHPERRRHRLTWLWVSLLVLFMAGLGLDIVRSWQRLNAPKAVPTWTNTSFVTAAAAARGMGFVVKRSDVNSIQPAGQVLTQDPKAGVKLKRGLTVTLGVSLGNQATVPDVSSKSVADATSILQGKGFRVVVGTQTVPGSADGQVASQDPPANAVASKGATITLTQTAVPPQDTPSSDTPSGDTQSPNPSLMCSLLGLGCSASPTPSPTPAKHHGGNG